jgi:hypothetical protein
MARDRAISNRLDSTSRVLRKPKNSKMNQILVLNTLHENWLLSDTSLPAGDLCKGDSGGLDGCSYFELQILHPNVQFSVWGFVW